MAIADRRAQRLRNAHHHQQVSIGQARKPGVECAQNIRFLAKLASERRARQIDIVRHDHQCVDGVRHRDQAAPAG